MTLCQVFMEMQRLDSAIADGVLYGYNCFGEEFGKKEVEDV